MMPKLTDDSESQLKLIVDIDPEVNHVILVDGINEKKKSWSAWRALFRSSLLMIDRDSFKRLLGTAESLLAEKAKKMYTLSEQK